MRPFNPILLLHPFISTRCDSSIPPTGPLPASVHIYRLPLVDFALTDEQSDFVDAIRDFCERECGTQDQRERLTDGYREHHSFDLYGQMAELGWLGVTISEEYGGSGGSMLDAC